MKQVTVIATGESVTPSAVKYIKHSVTDVMVVNESFLLAPWADYIVASDWEWWEHYGEMVNERSMAKCFSVVPKAKQFRPYPDIMEGITRPDGRGGLCKEPGKVYTGGSSGHAALNMCYHFGYDRIILVGFDLHGDHWFKETFRPEKMRKHNPYDHFKNCLDAIVSDLQDEDIDVVNCTYGSKLKLHYTPLDEAL